MARKKANPKTVHHLTDLELRKMETKWTHNASTLALCAFLSVMHDKEGYGAKRLKRVYDNVEKLSQEITEGRLDLKDIRDAMLEEIGVELGYEEEKMTTKDFARAHVLLDRIREMNALEDELKFLRQSSRKLWIHAGESHATVMQVPPELCGHLLDMLDGHVEQEKKNAEEEFEML